METLNIEIVKTEEPQVCVLPNIAAMKVKEFFWTKRKLNTDVQDRKNLQTVGLEDAPSMVKCIPVSFRQ